MGKHKFFKEQYATGQTKPPKSYGGLIAVLLILVIFLSGVISVLGLMNIELLRIVKNTNAENIPMLETAPQHRPKAAIETQAGDLHWGMACHAVTDFHARYYDIPQGIYISDVEAGCTLAKQGIQPGDILTHVNNIALEDPQTLTEIIAKLPKGKPVVFTLSRDNRSIRLSITLSEEFYGNDLS